MRYFYTKNRIKVFKDIGAENCDFNGAIDEIWCNLDLNSSDYYC